MRHPAPARPVRSRQTSARVTKLDLPFPPLPSVPEGEDRRLAPEAFKPPRRRLQAETSASASAGIVQQRRGRAPTVSRGQSGTMFQQQVAIRCQGRTRVSHQGPASPGQGFGPAQGRRVDGHGPLNRFWCGEVPQRIGHRNRRSAVRTDAIALFGPDPMRMAQPCPRWRGQPFCSRQTQPFRHTVIPIVGLFHIARPGHGSASFPRRVIATYNSRASSRVALRRAIVQRGLNGCWVQPGIRLPHGTLGNRDNLCSYRWI